MGLRAGIAARDICPRKPLALYGYPHVERVSTGVHDPLLATVTVLSNGADTVVLASLAVLMVEPTFARELRAGVARAVGCDECGVFISCTHTHSGPVTSHLIAWSADPCIPRPDAGYLDLLRDQLLDAAGEAMRSMVPAELAWTVADATGVGGNRLSDGGVTDPECGVLVLRHAHSHRPMGVSMIYGMHPTVMHEDSTLVSADFPCYACRHVQEHLGAEIPVTYHMAPAGNQSPRRFVDSQTFEEAERLGRKLGAAVWDAMAAISPTAWQTTAPLHGRLAPICLPRNPIRPVGEAEELLADYRERYGQLRRDNAPRAEVRTAECAVFGAEGTLELSRAEASGALAEKLAGYRRVEVQVLRIGQVDLVGLPGECFTEYSLEIKRHASRRTFVVSLVNGELQGYIVTPEAAATGGYEATNAVFAPDAGEALVHTALRMLRT